jgi:DNA-binding winged helix-turn-helix (wHTH) protein
MSDSEQRRLARFGAFELDPGVGELRRSGRLVALTGQPLRVLTLLVERAGDVVTRDELQRQIWGGDTHVDFDAGLSTCINQIRTALGDRAASPRFVETLPRRGYRFVAPVQWGAAAVIDDEPGLSAASIVAVALAAIIAAIVWPMWNPPQRSPIPIVVLPVVIDSTRTDLAPVSLSLTDALIGTLVTEAGDRARIASPIAVQHLRGKASSLKDISDIGAEYFVQVTLRSAGGPILVHSKLAHITGWIIWTSDRVLPLPELEREQLRLAGELARSVAHEILPTTSAAKRRTPVAAALPDYAQARDDLDAGRIEQGLAEFERAHQLDADHPGSLAGLAQALVENAWRGRIDRQPAYERAATAAHRALALDPENARALLALGAVVWLRDGQREPAERLFDRALAIDTSLTAAHEWRRRVRDQSRTASN